MFVIHKKKILTWLVNWPVLLGYRKAAIWLPAGDSWPYEGWRDLQASAKSTDLAPCRYLGAHLEHMNMSNILIFDTILFYCLLFLLGWVLAYGTVTVWKMRVHKSHAELAINSSCLQCTNGCRDKYHWINFDAKENYKTCWFWGKFWSHKGFFFYDF